MAETETTQEQWQSVMGDNPSRFKGTKNPVEQISWVDCQKFIEKINLLAAGLAPQGYRFALPTEAQWEYACRAGSTTAYCFGDAENQLGDYAWYDANSDSTTHPVGTKKANVWGIYDMHGNVWEWCSDWYGDYNGDTTDLLGASSGSLRVLRGGSWHSLRGVAGRRIGTGARLTTGSISSASACPLFSSSRQSGNRYARYHNKFVRSKRSGTERSRINLL
jgi:formylglycine-generating enzyme required for sulfatase activity